MPNLNKVFLMGHLTRDPELRHIPSGSSVCEFSLAVNRKWKDKGGESKEEVSYFDCIAWSRTAEVVAEHVKKGAPLFVEGYLKQDRWDDKDTGQKRSKIKVTAERVQFLGGKREGGASEKEEEVPSNDIPF